jgi:hypothetical protein
MTIDLALLTTVHGGVEPTPITALELCKQQDAELARLQAMPMPSDPSGASNMTAARDFVGRTMSEFDCWARIRASGGQPASK